jgi:hypothetical protein
MQEYIDAVSLDVMITEVGILVAGFAAVLGIWLERDHSKPPRYAWWLSLLIILCTFVGMFQTLADAKEGAKLEADMARMLATLDKIAQNSEVEIPELNEFVKNEVSAQARANPDVVKKLAQNVADEGGDPAEMLGSYLPPSEVQNVARKGSLNTKTPKVARPSTPAGPDAAGDEKPKGRRKLEFGGKAKVREPAGDKPKAKDDGDDGEKRVVRRGGDDDDDRKSKKDDDDKKDKKDDDDKKDKKDDDDKKKVTIGGRDDKDKKDDKAGAVVARPAGGLGPKPPAPANSGGGAKFGGKR